LESVWLKAAENTAGQRGLARLTPETVTELQSAKAQTSPKAVTSTNASQSNDDKISRSAHNQSAAGKKTKWHHLSQRKEI